MDTRTRLITNLPHWRYLIQGYFLTNWVMIKNSGQLLNIAAFESSRGFAGSLLGKILTLSLQVLVSRLFGPTYYGLFITSLIVCQLSQVVASLGLQKGGVRFFAIAYEKQQYKSLLDITGLSLILPLVLGFVMSGFVYLISPFLSSQVFNNPEMTTVLQRASLAIPFFALLRIGAELSRGFMTNRYSVIIENLFFPFVHIIFFLLLYLLKFGFSSVIDSFILANFLSAIMMLILLLSQIKRVLKEDWSMELVFNKLFFTSKWQEIVLYSLPLMPTALTHIGFNYVDIIMLNIYVEPSKVGEFAAPARLGFFFANLFPSITLIFAPLIAGQHGKNNMENINLLFKAMIRWICYMALPVLVFFLIASKEIMLIFGKEFTNDGPIVLTILMIGHIFEFISSGTGIILTMTGHQYKELINYLGSILLNILLNIILIPSYGLKGAAVATTLSRFIITVIRLYVVFHIFRIQPFTKKLSVPFGTTFIFYLGCYLVTYYGGYTFHSFINISIATICSSIIILIIISSGFEKEDHEIIKIYFDKIRKIGFRKKAFTETGVN